MLGRERELGCIELLCVSESRFTQCVVRWRSILSLPESNRAEWQSLSADLSSEEEYHTEYHTEYHRVSPGSCNTSGCGIITGAAEADLSRCFIQNNSEVCRCFSVTEFYFSMKGKYYIVAWLGIRVQ